VSAGAIRHGGIIAAGEGSRLRQDGWALAKPLVPVCGRPLIEHVIGNFRAAGVGSLAILFNGEEERCAEFVRERFPDSDYRVLMRTTASSLESFRLVAAAIGERLGKGERALISTVDALCAPADFRNFVASAVSMPPGATVLAVTPLVADERPLRAVVGQDGRIFRLGGGEGDLVTAGMYLMPDRILRDIPSEGLPRLRDFLKWLVDRCEPVYGVAIPIVIDVDRGQDVRLAESLLGEGGKVGSTNALAEGP
jgi:NDP-sugar pyrophosphorylase family protein